METVITLHTRILRTFADSPPCFVRPCMNTLNLKMGQFPRHTSLPTKRVAIIKVYQKMPQRWPSELKFYMYAVLYCATSLVVRTRRAHNMQNFPFFPNLFEL